MPPKTKLKTKMPRMELSFSEVLDKLLFLHKYATRAPAGQPRHFRPSGVLSLLTRLLAKGAAGSQTQRAGRVDTGGHHGLCMPEIIPENISTIPVDIKEACNASKLLCCGPPMSPKMPLLAPTVSASPKAKVATFPPRDDMR